MLHKQSPTDPFVTPLLANLLQLDAESAVLDLGCGSGHAGARLSRSFKSSVVFVDSSKPQLEALRQYKKKHDSEKLEIHCADAVSFLKRNNQKFDLIIAEGGVMSYALDEIVEIVSKNALKERGVLHFSMLTKRRVHYSERGQCDVPQIVPTAVSQQYENTILSETPRQLLFEDEVISKIKTRFQFVWSIRSSGPTWSQYYDKMYSGAKNPAEIRSTAIDEAYYKSIGQRFIDYTSFVAAFSSLENFFES